MYVYGLSAYHHLWQKTDRQYRFFLGKFPLGNSSSSVHYELGEKAAEVAKHIHVDCRLFRLALNRNYSAQQPKDYTKNNTFTIQQCDAQQSRET